MDFAVTKGTYRYVMFDAHPMGLILRIIPSKGKIMSPGHEME